MNIIRVYGQIQYENKDGDSVHSDLCGDASDPEFRKFLHDNLDEYLDNLAQQKTPQLLCLDEYGACLLNVETESVFYVHRGKS